MNPEHYQPKEKILGIVIFLEIWEKLSEIKPPIERLQAIICLLLCIDIRYVAVNDQLHTWAFGRNQTFSTFGLDLILWLKFSP